MGGTRCPAAAAVAARERGVRSSGDGARTPRCRPRAFTATGLSAAVDGRCSCAWSGAGAAATSCSARRACLCSRSSRTRRCRSSIASRGSPAGTARNAAACAPAKRVRKNGAHCAVTARSYRRSATSQIQRLRIAHHRGAAVLRFKSLHSLVAQHALLDAVRLALHAKPGLHHLACVLPTRTLLSHVVARGVVARRVLLGCALKTPAKQMVHSSCSSHSLVQCSNHTCSGQRMHSSRDGRPSCSLLRTTRQRRHARH